MSGAFYEEQSMTFYEVRNSFVSSLSNTLNCKLETVEINNILIDCINEYLKQDYISYDDDLFNLKLCKLGSIRGFTTFSQKPLFKIFHEKIQIAIDK
jgi:hypothetical protein